MQLPDIFLLALLLILLRVIPSQKIRGGVMILCCCVFLFLFQPTLPVRGLDFSFPLWTILLTACVYGSVSRQNPLRGRQNLTDLGIILVSVVLIAATRFVSYTGIVTASRPPRPERILPALAIGIALQNLPEGAIVSMPLRSSGMGKGRAFLCGVLSGAVEPLGALATVYAAGFFLPLFPYLLSFAAGAMFYVVAEELIPQMNEEPRSHAGIAAFAAGFALMMAMDVGLG